MKHIVTVKYSGLDFELIIYDDKKDILYFKEFKLKFPKKRKK